MKCVNVKLSSTIIPAYGNPLNLKEGEIRNVIFTSEIKSLFKNGVIVPIKEEKQKTENKQVLIIKKNIIKEDKINLNISGIGVKTLDDINKIYDNEKELIDALKKDKVPLYDHVVRKLKKYFKVK